MVVDTSVLVAILEHEPVAVRLSNTLNESAYGAISLVSVVEASMVMRARRGDRGEQEVDALIARSGLEVIGVFPDHLPLVREAFRRFGKGRHPAGLNLGDCFTYALARALEAPLLFVGNDFAQTDIDIAAY